IDLFKAEHELEHIAAQTGVNVRSVQGLVRRYKERGRTAYQLHFPSLVDPRTLKLSLGRRRPAPCLQPGKGRKTSPLGHVSLRCIQQVLHNDLGFKSYRARRKPLLTEKQKANRTKFCKSIREWDLEEWRTILRSHKAKFSVTESSGGGSTPHSNVYLPQYTVKTLKHPATFM
ncbi:putative Transposase-containing protein 23, partial [Homarus americanus]